MLTTKRVKLFKNGSSQAVRLPVGCRFLAEEVYVSRDDITGDVILSLHPGTRAWATFFDLVHQADIPTDFMIDRPMNVLPIERDIFGDE